MTTNYVYRVERIAQLLASNEPVLRLGRQFGPPRDYPHKMLEMVRKQLPSTRAVYKLECLSMLPKTEALRAPTGPSMVVLRIPKGDAVFAELTGMPDEREPDEASVYFGVDDAVNSTNRYSPNLAIPFHKIDIKFGDRWLALSPDNLEKLSHPALASWN